MMTINCWVCGVALGYKHEESCTHKGFVLDGDCYSTGTNQMPEGQGKRDKKRPRHDLIPIEFLDEISSIFEEGLKPRPGMPQGYGDSWKKGGPDFLIDCLNHASNHLHAYMNGDFSENQLSKVAWNVLVVRFHDLRKQQILKMNGVEGGANKKSD